MTEHAIQLALATRFNWFRNFLIPNVYLSAFEMDLAVITPSGYLWEVEIKRTRSDWKNDLTKGKWERYRAWHNDPAVGNRVPSRFYYAVPYQLVSSGVPDWVPAEAGVLAIDEFADGSREWAKVRNVRAPKRLHKNRIEQREIVALYRKIYVRFWPAMYQQAEKKETSNN